MDYSEYAYLSNDSQTDYSDDESSDEKNAIHAKAEKDIKGLSEGIKRLLATTEETGQQVTDVDVGEEEIGGARRKETVDFYNKEEDDANQDWVDKNLR